MTKLKEKANHFWREIDKQDFLLILAGGTFFLFIAIGLIMLLFGQLISPMYLELLSMMSPILITITSGIFGLKAVEKFKGENHKDIYDQERQPEQLTYYEDYDNQSNYNDRL